MIFHIWKNFLEIYFQLDQLLFLKKLDLQSLRCFKQQNIFFFATSWIQNPFVLFSSENTNEIKFQENFTCARQVITSSPHDTISFIFRYAHLWFRKENQFFQFFSKYVGWNYFNLTNQFRIFSEKLYHTEKNERWIFWHAIKLSSGFSFTSYPSCMVPIGNREKKKFVYCNNNFAVRHSIHSSSRRTFLKFLPQLFPTLAPTSNAYNMNYYKRDRRNVFYNFDVRR